MRGEKDQLQREITLLKRGQNDNSSGLEERLVKIEQRIATLEPVFFQLDGLEFQADITEKKDFELALASFKKGDFAGSIISFSAFLRKYPDSGFKQSAMFWLASAKYVKREYADVVNQLKSFTGMNESHSKFPEALLTLANSQLELKQTQDAKKTLTELISKFSSSEAAAAGKERLSKLK
jgi:tol-pal system protein YbgF